MKIEFELTKGLKGWLLTSRDADGSAETPYSSRRKALLSIVRRIELLKPSKHFKIIVEGIDLAQAYKDYAEEVGR